MRILLASSEVAPFAKTGGLADVASALPIALHGLGHDVRIALPRYRDVNPRRYHLRPATPPFTVRMGRRRKRVRLWQATLPRTRIRVYFVAHNPSFDRRGLYQREEPTRRDHPDNAERFALFCQALLAGVEQLRWIPDIVHANDWPTSLLATHLRSTYRARAGWSRTAAVMTIHNVAYQGTFPKQRLHRIGLATGHGPVRRLLLRGRLNLLHIGLVDSDRLTTVSPTYAREIQTRALGYGLDAVIKRRRRALHGILNGIDERTWNPATDPLLPARYTRRDLRGKPHCKRALQRRCGLPQRATAPLLGVVTRLVAQKGIDLLIAALPRLFEQRAVQCVILGVGETSYYRQLRAMQRRYPRHLALQFTFHDRLAHLIEAGADIFVMPSRYEPCGLNQLYSQRYGTVPVVRATGGLADTVVDATPARLRRGTATGFVFHAATPSACGGAIARAVAAMHRGQTWRRIMRRGMQQDFSWRSSAQDYVHVYQQARRDVQRAHARRSR